MPSDWLEVAVALCCFVPGWLALLGWRVARGTCGPQHSLADGVPALALSAVWTVPLMVLCGPALLDWWSAANSPLARAGLLVAILSALLAAPGLLAYGAGRLPRERFKTTQISATLVDGTTVQGFYDRGGSTEGTLVVLEAKVVQGSACWVSERVEIARVHVTVAGENISVIPSASATPTGPSSGIATN